MAWYQMLRVAVVGCCLAGLSACGGGGVGSTIVTSSPTPSIASVSPTSVRAGSGAFTLTVIGSGFVSGATVTLAFPGGRSDTVPATLLSSSQLTARISAADIDIPGSAQVTVGSPQGLGVNNSNSVVFMVNPRAAGIIQAISQSAGGGTPNGNSHSPVLSATGRVVVFSSEATNLIVPSAIFPEGYLRDTCLGINGCTPSTQLVSAINGGSMEGNGMGGAIPSIMLSPASSNLVGFFSTATNLVTPNTTTQQAFVRDTCVGVSGVCTPATVLASVTQNGSEPHGPATDGAITGAGCGFAFASNATDVVSGVTTPNQVYLSACSTTGGVAGGFTSAKLVSADNSGIAANQGASQPISSSSGRFVAFSSSATNLPGAPGGGSLQVYLRDTCAGGPATCTPSTVLVSVDNSGSPLAGNSGVPAISDNGRFVVFPNQAPVPTGGVTANVWLRDTCNSDQGLVANCTPATTEVSVAADGGAANGVSNSTPHALSGDGRFVVFSSLATNLIPGGNPSAQVFVRDTCKSSAGTISGCLPSTVLISVDSTGAAIGGFSAAISQDGHVAAFESEGAVTQIFLAATSF